MAPRSTPRAPRARRHEPRALDLSATSTRHKLTPTRLLRRPLSVFTVSPLTTRLPRSATAARRSTETGDRHHRRLRRLAADHAAARPPVDGKETSTTADRAFSPLPAGRRRQETAPPQTAPRTQPVAFAFGERESDETVVNQSRCPMVMTSG